MMVKRVGIKKGINPEQSNSFLAPYLPKRKERRVIVDRANEIARFCKERYPNGMRSRDLFAENGGLEWANRDNIRTPIRKLVTEGRLLVDTSVHPLVFTPKPSRKAQSRRCQGITKAGTPCKWEIQPWQNNGNSDFCKWHRRQDPNHWINHIVDRKDRSDMDALRESNKTAIGELQELSQNWVAKPDVVVVPELNKTVADIDEPWTILVPTDRHNELVIKLLKPDKGDDDNIYRDLILSFLDGEATIADLREAVKGLQEELKE